MNGGFHFEKRLDFGSVSRKLKKAGRKGLDDGLKVLYEASQQQVPRETGALARSGQVEILNDRTGRVSYGTAYGIVQHERTDFRHPAGGKAKYLEDPANDPGIQAEMNLAMGKAIRDELG